MTPIKSKVHEVSTKPPKTLTITYTDTMSHANPDRAKWPEGSVTLNPLHAINYSFDSQTRTSPAWLMKARAVA